MAKKKKVTVSYHNSVFFKYALTDEEDSILLPSIIKNVTQRNPGKLKLLSNIHTDPHDDLYVEAAGANGIRYFLKMWSIEITQSIWDEIQSHAIEEIKKHEKAKDGVKQVCEITFINGKAKDFHHALIHHLQVKDEHDKVISLQFPIQFYYVYLPYVNQLEREKGFANMTEFELLCYLFHNGEKAYMKKRKEVYNR